MLTQKDLVSTYDPMCAGAHEIVVNKRKRKTSDAEGGICFSCE